jgi:hypothetical protein
MKHPYSEEILSAYVDGELTDQERAEVEHWLESSPGARERLDDFRGLSRLFASLPRTEVPQEFPTKVLQLAERRMLLPEAAANSRGRRVRRWLIAVGAPLASAAVLLICLKLQFRDPAPGNLGGRNLPLPEGANRAAAKSADNIGRGAADAEGRFVAANTPGPVESKLTSQSASSQPAQPATGAEESADADAAGGGARREVTRAYPQLAQINRAIAEVRDSGDEEKLLTVVKMRVVDRADGLMLLQSVLAENNVVADDAERSLEKSEVGSVAKKSVAKGDNANGDVAKSGSAPRESVAAGHEALYVVAEPEQFIAAFKAILDRDDAPRLSVETPLEIAALNAESRKQLDDLFLRPSLREREPAISIGGDKDTETPKKAKLTGDDAAAPAAAKADRSTQAFPAPAAIGKDSENRPAEDKSQSRSPSRRKEMLNQGSAREKEVAGKSMKQAATGPARQFVVPLPKEVEERQSRAAATARPTAPEAPSHDIPAPPSPLVAKRADDANVDGRNRGDAEQGKRAPALVRVLIVIERETAPPAAAPAVQPAAGKGPGGA